MAIRKIRLRLRQLRRVHRRRRPGDARRQTFAPDFNWVTIARNSEGRLAYMGFSNVWYPHYYDAEYNQTKVFTITDRPVYRPGQTVKFKFWVRHAKYDEPNASDFGNRDFDVEIHDPKNNKSLGKQFHSDAYGGIEAEFELPSDATLGVYQLYVLKSWRRQLSGRGIQEARIRSVGRCPERAGHAGRKDQSHDQGEILLRLAGQQSKSEVQGPAHRLQRELVSASRRGIGSMGRAIGGSPTTSRGIPAGAIGVASGRFRLVDRRGYQQPEVVADAETTIGPDGTLVVEIDTAAAKAVHPDEDHAYQITAEVVDPSRRTIVGTGSVLVARKPFQVTAWVDRGYYRAGDQVEASFSARTLDGKPVAGHGHLILYRVRTTRKMSRSSMLSRNGIWTRTGKGMARQSLKAAAAGQYRLSYHLTDAKKHTIEGGYLFTVTGEVAAAENFRFNDLELIPDRRNMPLATRSNCWSTSIAPMPRSGCSLRPANGVYLPAENVAAGRKKHDGRHRRNGQGHAELLCRSADHRRRPNIQ